MADSTGNAKSRKDKVLRREIKKLRRLVRLSKAGASIGMLVRAANRVCRLMGVGTVKIAVEVGR